jgi:hypothetical protein
VRAVVAPVGERAQDANDGRDAHTPADEDETLALDAVNRESAVRSVQVHASTGTQADQQFAEVAERPDRELFDMRTLCRRRNRERVLFEHEW